MSRTIFDVENLTYSYPGTGKVLNGISFTISEGESVVVLGANASGKSTILKLLDGLCFAEIGRVEAFGETLLENSINKQFRKNVGLLFQNPDAQLFCTSVEEEVAFGPLQLGVSESEVERRVADTLSMLGIEHLRERPPQSLSGGEKKKVALASIISCGQKVILLDEPNAGLDPRTLQWLVEFLRMLNKSGVTLIAATHNLSFAADIADRALILSEDHRLVYDGTIDGALSDLELLLSVNLAHAHSHRHGGIVHEHPHLHEVAHDHEHVE